MTQSRFYSSVATKTTLNGTISPTAVTMVVASAAGFPGSFPYVLLLERDTANEEIVDVTAASGTTLTVTRGVDGTSGITHTTGAVVEHGTSARDFTEAGVHRGNATVHLPASVGTNGQVATLVAGAPAWVDPTAGVDSNPWTTYTPVVTATSNPTWAAGKILGRYKILGKTVLFNISISDFPTSAGSGTYSFPLPPGCTTPNVTGYAQPLAGLTNWTGHQGYVQAAVGANQSSFSVLSGDGGALLSDAASFSQLFFQGSIEIA